MLARHFNLFRLGLGKIEGMEVKLYLKPHVQPKFCRAQQVPFAILEKEIDRQVDEEIIEPTQLSEWATSVVPVIKKDGSMRHCGDYKVTVNRTTKTNAYPLPI